MQRDNPRDTHTNFGWWSDRPEREERPSTFRSPLTGPREPEGKFSWGTAILVVLLMTALTLSLKSLAGW